MALIIRVGGAADLPAVAAVQARASQVAYEGVLRSDVLAMMNPDDLLARWVERLSQGSTSHRLVVAEADRLIGFAFVGPDPEPGVGEVVELFVDPPNHGTGVGAALMAAARATLIDMGFERHSLWVLEGNERAMRFYAKGGWQPDGMTVMSSRGVYRQRWITT
jgi:GNAT superfamily N-acetyltransferase